MKILIAPDKFKGSLSALAVGEAIQAGLRKNYPQVEFSVHPMADGGDGSLAILEQTLDLQRMTVAVEGPLGQPLTATYLMDDTAAYVEVASASGLVLLDPAQRDPLITSSYGTGLMMRDALERGSKRIYLFLGGSVTNDLGFGIAAALGFQFFSSGKLIKRPAGGDLSRIDRIEGPGVKPNVEVILLCDVKNPLFGPNGAAHVYARQKGADELMVEQLDAGLQSSHEVLKAQWGKDASGLAGGGAAGGIAAGLHVLLDARIQPGFTTISQITGLEAKVVAADRVISGEGMLDGQSLEGKVVDGLAKLCQQYQKPLHLFVGDSSLSVNECESLGIVSVQTVRSKATDLTDAMGNAAIYLTDLATELRW